jgi:hypothetical protein
MELLRGAWRLVMDHRRAYVVLNVGYYGLVGVAMLYVALVDPSLQERLMSDVQASLTEGSLEMVGASISAEMLWVRLS